ncbi:MAG: hypothetical protein ACRBBP_08970 [Bdellovibrionales bacterium]
MSLATDFVYRSGESGQNWQYNAANSKGLKVVWWNIGCISDGAIRHLPPQQKHDEKPVNLLKNIEALLEKPRLKPDVLILGEYCPRKIEENKNGVSDFLSSHYPHMHKIDQYTRHHSGNGMRIFSKHELKNIKETVLPSSYSNDDWLKRSQMKSCAIKQSPSSSSFKSARYEFPAIDFTVTAKGKDYKIIGTHFPNPWPLMVKCLGKFSAALKLLFGINNPNYSHARRLRHLYKGSKSTLLIGDFNAPKLFFGAPSNTYSLLTTIFRGPSIISSEKSTVVDHRHGAGSYSIDHAFASGDLEVSHSDVIPLAGSDHLPIYVTIY